MNDPNLSGEERAPMARQGDDMDLPEGMMCADCVHCRRCCLMFGHIPADQVCDWSPSRFRKRALSDKENEQ